MMQALGHGHIMWVPLVAHNKNRAGNFIYVEKGMTLVSNDVLHMKLGLFDGQFSGLSSSIAHFKKILFGEVMAHC